MNVWWCDLNKHTVKCFSGMITYIVDARIQICRQISVSWKRPLKTPVVSGSWLLPEQSNQFKLTAESREIIQLRFHTYWNLATTSVINSNYVVLITIFLSNVQSQWFGSRWRPETDRVWLHFLSWPFSRDDQQEAGRRRVLLRQPKVSVPLLWFMRRSLLLTLSC